MYIYSIENVQYAGKSKYQWQFHIVFTPILLELFCTNIPTVLPVVILNYSNSNTFLDFVFNPTTCKFRKARGKKKGEGKQP